MAPYDMESILLPVSNDFVRLGPPNSKFLEGPLIVPPTWNKSEFNKDIAQVWRHAAQVLAQAENIYIMGYSLPDTDMFFRYLFALGTTSETVLRRFWVFNPDSKVKTRYESLLGPGSQAKFEFFNVKFAEALNAFLALKEQIASRELSALLKARFDKRQTQYGGRAV